MSSDRGAESSDAPLSHNDVAPMLEQQNFKEMQKEYFAGLLAQALDCDVHGHTICVLTIDGKHHQLSREEFDNWVRDRCVGKATTAQPPECILGRMIHVSTRPREFLTTSSPHHIVRSPALATSASLRSRLETLSNSLPSSGTPGPGYYSGKVIKWLGTVILTGLEDVVVFKHTCKHLALLKRWTCRDAPEIGIEKQRKLFRIAEDALEMSRPCYSPRVRKYSQDITFALECWLRRRPSEKENMSDSVLWACVACGTLASSCHPDEQDLWCELQDILTRVPLSLQDAKAISAVVCALARCLTYAPRKKVGYIILSENLFRIVRATLHTRGLFPSELQAIRNIGIHQFHLARDEIDAPVNVWGRLARMWQIILFVKCSSQDPWLNELSFDQSFQRSLTAAFDEEYQAYHILFKMRDGYMFRDPEFLRMLPPTTMPGLLHALRQSTSERRATAQCKAMHIMRLMVDNQPTLLKTLIEENAAPDLEASMTLPRPRGDFKRRLYNEKIRDAKYLLERMEDTVHVPAVPRP